MKNNNNIQIKIIYRLGYDQDEIYGGKNKILFTMNCILSLIKIHPDVIHTHGAWYCLFPGTIYRVLKKCILVHTFHTEPEKKLNILNNLFLKNLLKQCDYTTFVSNNLKSKIQYFENYSFKKTAITYAGIKKREVSSNEIKLFRDKHKIKNDNIIVLAQAMTAHPLKANGLKISINAIKILKKIYPKMILIITRNGRYVEELKTYVHNNNLDNEVMFMGDLNNPYIALEICNIFLHTPLGEGGVSLALLEAMSMGLPIIASNVGGIPEVIEDGVNGILVDNNEITVAKKVDYLLQNQKVANELGKCAIRTVETKYTWDNTINILLQCYQGLL